MLGSFAFMIFTAALCDFYCSHINANEFLILKLNASTWSVKKNSGNYTLEQLKSLAGVIGFVNDQKYTLPVVFQRNIRYIPDHFDSRERWPECESIRTIRNQGACGSCWAFASAGVMSDRLCIATGGEIQFTFSPEEVLSCCSYCGYGCDGGYFNTPFNYWVANGIPSGGDYGSNLGCKPYTAFNGSTPECSRSCVPDYHKELKDDIRYGVLAYLIPNITEEIQQEIITNGPVVSMMEFFEDLYRYDSGIYQYTFGNFVSYHSVKIIGWGIDNDIPYWLVANSWGTTWGEDGFFKVLRGSNNVKIEQFIAAGIPEISE